MKAILEKLSRYQELSPDDVNYVIEGIRQNHFSDTQIAAFLMGLLMKGPTTAEVTAIARVMRANCIAIHPKVSGDLTDTCGTGGGLTTFNVSSANSILTAAAGVNVAKHGSRSISASSGSADVLEQLGIAVEIEPQQAEKLIESVGYSFLYGPFFHPVLLKVFGPENELGIKTIFFTIIGPLINPAGATRHLLGVYQPHLVAQVTEVARDLGYKHALVVHGVDGLDEVSILGETQVGEVKDGAVNYYTVTPEELGFQRTTFDEIKGGSPQYNAQVVRNLIEGKDKGPRRDFLLMNAAAAFYISGKAISMQEGAKLAGELIDSGQALAKLEQIVLASKALR